MDKIRRSISSSWVKLARWFVRRHRNARHLHVRCQRFSSGITLVHKSRCNFIRSLQTAMNSVVWYWHNIREISFWLSSSRSCIGLNAQENILFLLYYACMWLPLAKHKSMWKMSLIGDVLTFSFNKLRCRDQLLQILKLHSC